jgi:4-amino-4-deoxychorismate lyase
MLDSEGYVVEGTMSNLFLVIDGELHTPLIDRCGVAGVVRGLVLERARAMRRPVNVRRIEQWELEQAEGLFLTSSLLGIVPVHSVDGREKVVRLTHHPVLEAVAGSLFEQNA